MELKIKDYQLPSEILFNFEELKAELTEKVRVYETIVYTDDKIKEAEADKANLNKLKKALNDERIRREKEYMAPFKAFKAQVDEIIGIIDKPIAIIDKQVKEYEKIKKTEKRKQILAYMATFVMPYDIDLTLIFDPRWLNATASMASVKAAIDEKVAIIHNDLGTLQNLGEYSDFAIADYIGTLDLRHAMDTVKRESERREQLAKIKAAQEEAAKTAPPRLETPEAPKAEIPQPEARPQARPLEQWVNFSVLLDVEKARKLKAFFETNGFQFKRI